MFFRLLPLLLLVIGLSAAAEDKRPIRLLVITGSHDFDPRFYSLFEGHPDIQWDKKTHGGDPCSAFTEDFAKIYDAVLLYDFESKISEAQKRAFESAFGGGRGLIVLHHALCSHPDWPKFREIAGGQFLFEARDGLPQSTYKGNVEMRYEVVDPAHPATEGVGPIRVVEEPYKHVYRPDDAVPLLRADHPESDAVVAWATTYGESRVVAIEPGHGGDIFVLEEYRKLLAQSIRWVAGRTGRGSE